MYCMYHTCCMHCITLFPITRGFFFGQDTFLLVIGRKLGVRVGKKEDLGDLVW